LRELDKEYKLTDEHYTIDDFIEDLKKRIHQRRIKGWTSGGITAKQNARSGSFRSDFGNLKRSGSGKSKTKHSVGMSIRENLGSSILATVWNDFLDRVCVMPNQ
jgi:hypothetical protein